MANTHSPSATTKATSRDVLKVITALCNELDELMLLHEFYYRAAESVFVDDDTDKPVQRMLSVFPEWLRQRDTEILATAHELQEGLRTQP